MTDMLGAGQGFRAYQWPKSPTCSCFKDLYKETIMRSPKRGGMEIKWVLSFGAWGFMGVGLWFMP